MVRSERMRPVARLAETKESEAAKALADATARLAEQQQRLDDLTAYRDEYTARFKETSGLGVSAARFQQFQRFLASLGEAIEQQRRVVDSARRLLEERRRLWQGARSKTKALESVVEKYQQEEALAAGRKEQKEIDDLVQAKAARKHDR